MQKHNFEVIDRGFNNGKIATVYEMTNIFLKLIYEGKGNYTLHSEGFCCGIGDIEIDNTDKKISLD